MRWSGRAPARRAARRRLSAGTPAAGIRGAGRLGVGLLALGLLPGCLSMEVPKPFLVIEESAGELKAISPDEAKIWVREFDDSNQGDLAFWSEVLRNDFVENRGYTLLEEGDVQDGDGHPGKEYLFEVTAGGEPQRYLISLFVIEGGLSSTVCTVELVARRDVFEKHLAGVRKAVGTLAP